MAKRRVKLPRWANHLVKLVGQAVQPIDPLGEIGFRLEPAKLDGEDGWRLTVYPRLNELWGGAKDGMQVPPGFSLCLTRMLQLFDVPPHADWTTPTTFTGHFDGPHISLDGIYRDNRLLILFYDQPPHGDGISLVINTFTGEAKEYEGADVDKPT